MGQGLLIQDKLIMDGFYMLYLFSIKMKLEYHYIMPY